MTTQRTLAVLAAVLFVSAVGLATVGPDMVTLATVVAWLSPAAENGVHEWLDRLFGPWAWTYVGRPLLIRPAWLPFGSLGLVLAGVALSWPASDATRRSHRRS